MKKSFILIVLLLSSCVTSSISKNPFDVSRGPLATPHLRVINNYWDLRFIKIYCGGSQIQIIRGIQFNSTVRRSIRYCGTYYSFNANDLWWSNNLNWEDGDINLVVEPNISLSYVYLSRY